MWRIFTETRAPDLDLEKAATENKTAWEAKLAAHQAQTRDVAWADATERLFAEDYANLGASMQRLALSRKRTREVKASFTRAASQR